MEELQLKEPGEFEHQIVVAEAGDCKCGSGSHEEGYVLWGGVDDPNDMPIDAFGTVEQLHSVEVEYRQT